VAALSGISTHILDTSRGKPAAGVAVTLERRQGSGWEVCAASTTDNDGRCNPLLPPAEVVPGRYCLTFATGAYFARDGGHTLYPEITITFDVSEAGANYHLPLLLNPFGYTTYRGS
jgi:5-hydroxyisourate hydrolase